MKTQNLSFEVTFWFLFYPMHAAALVLHTTPSASTASDIPGPHQHLQPVNPLTRAAEQPRPSRRLAHQSRFWVLVSDCVLRSTIGHPIGHPAQRQCRSPLPRRLLPP
jgi:hypothetical protein